MHKSDVEIIVCLMDHGVNARAAIAGVLHLHGVVSDGLTETSGTADRDDDVSPELPFADAVIVELDRAGSGKPQARLAIVLVAVDGVCSCASKNASLPGDIAAAIRKAMYPRKSSASQITAKRSMLRLTIRENEILQHLIAGETSKEIARKLGNSPRTIQVHRAKVLAKLGARNVAEAVGIALNALGTKKLSTDVSFLDENLPFIEGKTRKTGVLLPPIPD